MIFTTRGPDRVESPVSSQRSVYAPILASSCVLAVRHRLICHGFGSTRIANWPDPATDESATFGGLPNARVTSERDHPRTASWGGERRETKIPGRLMPLPSLLHLHVFAVLTCCICVYRGSEGGRVSCVVSPFHIAGLRSLVAAQCDLVEQSGMR
ncbi:uncharacterized protein EV422DRAFT_522568 [Fimicolochytrium jonesii]|uniref:uncharacterized protein n=1 Tax=Fimicolochytrium jonesii TaxID=1396493 RepID=UPI0022FEFB15|nr:uncharacterized protein EV422DRAFT_522568 [Fimicolochytrium jonesii]KAI8822893.1 hypothetical protein EV422DRAFT_522568 [Fimicolochytrium jonesii]